MIIVVCESVPTQVSGNDHARAVLGLAEHDLRQVLEVDLVTMPVSGGTTRKFWKRLLPPAQELVALAVALELELDVVGERIGRAEAVDLHRVVDDQIDGHQRIDAARIAAEAAHRVAHRRQIDDRRDAGEVLQQHARRHERHFADRWSGRIPRRHLANVLGAHEAAVLVAEEVLQQDADAERQPVDVGDLRPRQRGEGEVVDAGAAHRQAGAGIEAVQALRAHRRMLPFNPLTVVDLPWPREPIASPLIAFASCAGGPSSPSPPRAPSPSGVG